MSRAFDFNVSYDPTKIQPNKEFIMEIITPIFNVIKCNPERPFGVNVDFKDFLHLYLQRPYPDTNLEFLNYLLIVFLAGQSLRIVML
jgi:hypothetical protein